MAIGVPLVADAAALTSAIIGGVTVDGQRTGMQALLDGKSVHNAQPRLIVCPGHSANQAVASAMDGLSSQAQGNRHR